MTGSPHARQEVLAAQYLQAKVRRGTSFADRRPLLAMHVTFGADRVKKDN